MTKLEKLYSIIENSRDVGVKLPKEVLQQVEELEENIIKEEILPALSSAIAPRLEPIKRDLVLVVEYHPGEPISVALSRKAKISEIMGAKTLTESNSVPVNSKDNVRVVNEPTGITRNSSKGMRVTFPDGTVVWSHKAVVTFIETLRKIGFEKIPPVGIMHGGYPLVGKQMRPNYDGNIWQHKTNGWYIYSKLSNEAKIRDLKTISDYYHLGLKIVEEKPK